MSYSLLVLCIISVIEISLLIKIIFMLKDIHSELVDAKNERSTVEWKHKERDDKKIELLQKIKGK